MGVRGGARRWGSSLSWPALAAWGDLARSLERFGPVREYGEALKTPKELLGILTWWGSKRAEGMAAWVLQLCGTGGDGVMLNGLSAT